MNTLSASTQPSTFQELANFLRELNGNKGTSASLLKKGNSSGRFLNNLEKQFSNVQQETVFRRLGRHSQLALNFTQSS